MDIALIEQPDVSFDIEMDGPDLLADDGICTAVILSLFLDARANADDPLPDPQDPNLRGSWMDSYPQVPGDLQGSKLWLLGKSKELPSVLTDAQDYELAALQWLIDDGWATQISVTATNPDEGVLDIEAEIMEPGSVQATPFTFGNV